MRGSQRWMCIALLIGCSLAPLGAWAQESKATREKPVLEQILDLMLQRGEINQQQYQAVQDKAKQEQATTLHAGIENGRPFFKSADENVHIEMGGRVQEDFDAAEKDARSLTGTRLGSQFLLRRLRLEIEGRLFRSTSFVIEADFSDTATLRNGYLNFAFAAELQFRAGQLKVPFRICSATSSRWPVHVRAGLSSPCRRWPSPRDRACSLEPPVSLVPAVGCGPCIFTV